jgi:hypothetical protein
MIKEKDFIKVVELLQKCSNKIDVLQKYNIDMIDYDDDYHKIINILLGTVLTEKQLDWFSWWMYERTPPGSDKILEAYNGDGSEIDFSTVELLYVFLMTL